MDLGSQFLNRMKEFIKENKLIKRGDKILIAFSGGADSTALIHSLMTLKVNYHLNLLAAHVNYNLRGAESISDMNFVKEFCFQHNISLVIKDVKLTQGANLENEARKIRFDFFNSLTKIYKVDKIAIGHNKNDVIETMLLHLFRGSGITGMRGIVPSNDNIIRPLLCFKREEIIGYLESQKITNWCQDSSNIETVYTRNKLRNNMVPWLEENINHKLTDILYDNSLIFRETDDYLRDVAGKILKKAILNHNYFELRLDLTKIEHKNTIILFYLFREAIGIISGSETNFYHSHFKEICSILSAKGSKMIHLTGNLTVRKEYDQLTFVNEEKPDKLMRVEETLSLTIDISKKYHVFGNKRILSKRINRSDIKRTYYEDDNIALLDIDKLTLPISVGFRKNGDKFIPMGMKGTKKLKDFFIDEKISKFERDKVLIFRDSEKIVWIAGLRIDDRVKINDSTQSLLLLKMENIRIRSRKNVPKKKK
ncbi:MAG: tRNA lysidine(34) synthetase TilS [Candidatus Cloacimonetes bacterium]|nr:tRNA lysidine(34) synthetase TilS [Candidatus Cloacimonadota bacterium]